MMSDKRDKRDKKEIEKVNKNLHFTFKLPVLVS